MCRDHGLDACKAILTVLIVCHHCIVASIGAVQMSGARAALLLISQYVAWTTPTFFFISGYLLTLNSSSSDYRRKMKSRLERIGIPYFAWNLFFLCAFLLCNTLFPHALIAIDGGHRHTLFWCICKVVGFSTLPADNPLWYVRALLGYSLFFPIVMWMARGGFRMFLGLVGVGLFCAGLECSGLNKKLSYIAPSYSIFSFYVGCLCGTRAILPLIHSRKACLILWLIASFAAISLPAIPYSHFLQNNIQVIIWMSLLPFCRFIWMSPIVKELASSSFCIYCAHMLFMPVVGKICRHVSELSISCYLQPILIGLLCVCVIAACVMLRLVMVRMVQAVVSK